MAKLTRAMGNRQIDAVFSSLNTGKGIYASEDFDYIAGMAQLKREVKDLLKLTSDPEYRYWLNNLDISEYTKYFKKITELAETFRLQKANQMKDAEFLTLDELSSNFNQETKYDKRIDVINTFSLNDLQRWEKDYADKEAVLSAMIKTGFFESADSDTINKFLTSFSNRDRNAFIQRCFDSPDLLMSIFQKENIKSQKYLLALLLDFGTGSDTDKNTYEIPQGQVFNASFVDSKMYINYMKEVPYEDNMYELDKQVQLPTPFTNVSFFYGENNKITLPAISLIGNMDNRLYDDYYKCNTDISQLTDDEKKVLFDEFVDHYLGKAFIAEFLSNPLSLLKTVGLSLATGILLMFASEAVAVGLAIAGSGLGIISSSLDLKSGLEMLESVAELKKNARNVNDYKEAARLLAEAMVKISVNGIMLIVSLIQFGEACGKGFELYYRDKKVCAVGSGNDSERILTNGEQFDNGKLKPNIKYKAGEYDYLYETDELGRIKKCTAEKLYLKKHQGRLKHNRKTPGKSENDHAGHIIGDIFGGSPELDNLVSQKKLINQKTYRDIERQWQNALSSGKKVTDLNIQICYDGNNVRPKSFVIEYCIEGKYYSPDPLIN